MVSYKIPIEHIKINLRLEHIVQLNHPELVDTNEEQDVDYLIDLLQQSCSLTGDDRNIVIVKAMHHIIKQASKLSKQQFIEKMHYAIKKFQ